MTPGINAARKAAVPHTIHEYDHDPASESYGTEAAEKTGVDPARVFKTLVVAVDGKELVVAIAILSADDTLLVHAGRQHLKLKPSDIEHYRGERGRRGNKLPRGYQRVDSLDVERAETESAEAVD